MGIIYIFYNKINVKNILHTFFTYVAMSSSVIGSAETAPRLLTAEKFCGKGIGDSTSSPSALGDIGTALDPVFESSSITFCLPHKLQWQNVKMVAAILVLWTYADYMYTNALRSLSFLCNF